MTFAHRFPPAWAFSALLFLLLWKAAAPAAADGPRVMLLIEEKNLGTIPTSEVEALAASLLLREDVDVMDQEMVRANLQKDQKLLKMAGDLRGAAALGLQFGADIVIVGEAVAKPAARRIADSNLRTYQAVVTLRAVNTETSRTIASSSETASVIDLEDVSGGSKALKSAGSRALNGLIDDMLVEWELATGSMGDRRELIVHMGGVDKVWKLKAIRRMFRSQEDLFDQVKQKSYTAGTAEFELLASEKPEDVAEKLVLGAPEGLSFQVLDIGSNRITLRVAEK